MPKVVQKSGYKNQQWTSEQHYHPCALTAALTRTEDESFREFLSMR